MLALDAIGKLKRISLREVWRHEAYDFTRWLQDNIDVVNEALDLNLTPPDSEQAAGDFRVDLVAEDEAGGTAVIENQLEKSDHDHLGKLITYVANYQAKYAIWIVAAPRPEHIQAVNWLNEAGMAAFYLVKVEAIKIGDSQPAPLLTLIVGPSQESLEVGETKKEIAERYTLRQQFWAGLLDRAKEKTRLHANITPGQYHWIGAGSGKSGLSYNYTIRKDEAVIELYIDRGKDSEQENQAIFEQLIGDRDAIEASFGDSLIWARLEGKRACRIQKVLTSGGYRNDEDEWPAIHEEMIDTMIRLEGALKPYINQLNI